MIISFAQTSPAIIDKSKTVTRRFWKDEYARRFKTGSIHDAWDHSPRTGKGKRIGRLMVTSEPYKEPLRMMSDDDFQREGGTRFWKDQDEFIELMGGSEAIPWVIRFETVWVY